MSSQHSSFSRRSAGLFAKAVSVAVAGLLVLAGVAGADELPEPVGERKDFLVTFAAGTTGAERDAALFQVDAVVTSTIPVLRLASVSLTDADAAELNADAAVSSVEADRVREIQGVPGDPSYADQWALPQIGWDTAYSSITPNGDATVAVLDTGVNLTPDLDGRLVGGTSMLEEIPGTEDPNGHGTAMASIVAAGVDNSVGIAGVGYQGVSVMPVKVLDADGLGQDSAVVEGVVYAADHGADVILMSFSNPGASSALQAAVDYAWSKGAVLVAATGNDGSTTATYPAGTAKVVGVSATGRDDSLWSGSNSGADTFLAAPGVDIATGSGIVTGTSASAAIVAGAAALVVANDPSASNGVVVGRLARTADAAGSVSDTGNGRVDLARALADVSTDPVAPEGVAGDGGPIVGPYVAAALGVSATYNASTTSITAQVTGANSGKSYDFRYTPPAGGGSSLDFTCISPGGSGGNVTFTHSASLPAGFTAGVWSISVFEHNSGQGCDGVPNRTADTSTTATVLAPATISGAVFNDANNNGNLDSGEALSGAPISLYRDSNTNGTYDAGTDVAVSTQNSTATGTWSFGSLGLSTTYFVLRTNPSGFTSSNAIPGTDSGTTTTKVTNDQLKVVVSGSAGASSAGIKFVARTNNTAPVAVNDTVTTAEDTAVAFNVIANDTDADGDLLAVKAGSISAPAHGTATLVATGVDAGKILYTPNANYNGPDSFTYRATAGGLDSNIATVSVTVSGANDAPVALDDTRTTAEDTGAAFNVIANDTDADGDPLAVKAGSISAPAHGTATLVATGDDAGKILYTPNANYNGPDSFTYRATDGGLDSNIATVNVTVSGANDAPVTLDDEKTVAEDTGAAVNVLANDTDADRRPGRVKLAPMTQPATAPRPVHGDGVGDLHPGRELQRSGLLHLPGNRWRPGSNIATVNVTVSEENDKPDAVDDEKTVAEDSGASTVNVLANDSKGPGNEGDQQLEVTEVTQPVHGTVAIAADGLSVTYTPDGNYNGPDSFTYRATDDGATAGADDFKSDTATVNVTVSEVNDTPVAEDDAASTDEDTAVSTDVITNDTDLDNTNAELSVDEDSISATNGTATLAADGRTIAFTPAADKNNGNVGPAGFTVTYKATDGTLLSNQATLTISVTAVNDTPVAEDDAASTDEDTAVSTDVITNDTDLDNTNAELSVDEDSISATNGTATLAADGRTIAFTPAADKNNGNVGPAGFTVTYKATDGTLLSNQATLTISVTAVNDTPVAEDDAASTDEDTAVSTDVITNDTDLDNTNAELSVDEDSISATNGTATLAADGRTIAFTPAADKNNGNVGPAGFTVTYKATDGTLLSNQATLTISVTAVNDTPVAEDDAASTDEDTAVSTDVITNDTDLDNTNAELSVDEDSISATNGTATLAADGRTIAFTPAADKNNGNVGPAGFTVTYKATDGTLLSNQATLTISVTAVNDTPVAEDDAASTDEDTAVSTDVITNDTDLDNTNAELSVDEDSISATNGTATLAADGRTIAFTPAADKNNGNVGPAGFTVTYKATDGTLLSNQATLTISVTAVNDTPVAEDDAASTDEDTAVSTDVITNDTDLDNTNAELSVDEDSISATNGTATLAADGRTIAFTPAADKNNGNVGPAGFTVTYKATDGTLLSNQATLTISVTAVNDTPVAEDDAASTDEDTAVSTDVITNDTDLDNTNAELSVDEDSISATNGTATLAADGRTIAFTPAADKNNGNVGPAGFTVTYKATDGTLLSNQATLTISVTAVNDTPVAEDDAASTDEDTAVSTDVITNDTDLDNTNAELSVDEDSISATNGTATLAADGRTIAFTPAADKNNGNVGPAGFTVTYKATDGTLLSNQATLTISVTAVNDTPVVTGGAAQTVNEGSSATVSATYTDIDAGQSHTYVINWGDGSPSTTGSASGGTVTGSHTYADNRPGEVPYVATITVTDNGTTAGSPDPKSGQGSVNVTVRNVAPVVDTVTMSSIDPVTGNASLSATFTDPGADEFSGGFTVTYGTTTISVPGNVTGRTMTGAVKLPRGCFTYIVAATVTDDDGGTGTKSATYGGTDVYQISFKDPIRGDERNIAKYGNVVPVKVLLTSSCSGAAVLTPELHLTIAKGVDVPDSVLDDVNVVVESVSNADSGTKMRTSGGMYIYNLSTKSLVQGTEYTLRVRSGSSTGPVLIKALLHPKK